LPNQVNRAEEKLVEVSHLAKTGRFDYLVIESTGISEPLPVAETFTFRDEEETSLSDVANLDTMVTVVDAVNFSVDLDEADSLQARGESLGEEDECTVSDLLIDQVEFADVIVINKIDLITAAERERLENALRQLNRHAENLASFGKVPLDRVIGQHLEPMEACEILDRCLLTADEMDAGLEVWRTFDNPFQKWFAEQSEG
jgi:G3E family GTPase